MTTHHALRIASRLLDTEASRQDALLALANGYTPYLTTSDNLREAAIILRTLILTRADTP